MNTPGKRRFLFLTLALAALLPAQVADRTAGPHLAIAWHDGGRLHVTVRAEGKGTGFLVLLASLDLRMGSPGPGLPDVLADDVVVAVGCFAGPLTASAPWPPVDVLLQAVQVRLLPDFAVTASPVQRVMFDALPPLR